MMLKNKREYGIETAAEKLLNEVRLQFRKAARFFFTIPERKEDKMIYTLETLTWLLLTIVLILRMKGY